jgi:hypothetical protein
MHLSGNFENLPSIGTGDKYEREEVAPASGKL